MLWLRSGLDYDAFWARTPREIDLILRARAEARREEHDRQRGIAYELAALIAFAFHEPKKLPEFEPTRPAGAPSTRADEEHVRAWFIAMASQGGQ